MKERSKARQEMAVLQQLIKEAELIANTPLKHKVK